MIDLLKIYFDQNTISSNKTFLTDFKKNSLPENNKTNLFVGNPDILLPAFKSFLVSKYSKPITLGIGFGSLRIYLANGNYLRALLTRYGCAQSITIEYFQKFLTMLKKYHSIFQLIEKNYILSTIHHSIKKISLLFFFNFDFTSHIERKNPIGLINAFLLAYKDDDTTHLYLKSINGDKKLSEKKKILKLIKDHKNITLDDSYCSYNKVMSMINQSDCYVSLHRAEGLGFGMAEAMLLGKPVIATNYSGNLEYMSTSNFY